MKESLSTCQFISVRENSCKDDSEQSAGALANLVPSLSDLPKIVIWQFCYR